MLLNLKNILNKEKNTKLENIIVRLLIDVLIDLDRLLIKLLLSFNSLLISWILRYSFLLLSLNKNNKNNDDNIKIIMKIGLTLIPIIFNKKDKDG